VSAELPVRPAGTRVAVIDDDESVCRAVGRFLRASGIESVAYRSAEAFLSGNPCDFDCLLLDVQLAGISGIELYEQLPASGSRPPAVFLTAHDEPDLRARAFRAGCAAILLKNDVGHAVLAAIDRAIARKGTAPAR